LAALVIEDDGGGSRNCDQGDFNGDGSVGFADLLSWH